MNILPKVKSYTKKDGQIEISGIRWVFQEGIDKRIISAAKRLSDEKEGFPICVYAGNTDDESYKIEINKNEASISSDGSRGAFYAIMSLSQMMNESNGIVDCCTIEDKPDMTHRGFYHDITRGKIPTLDTLKELVDILAYCKVNSLQLYVEHVFEFPEYAPCREKLGSISEKELRELDEYCYERFIDLIPSLASFGHLYHLIQDCGYSHLSELNNYTPHYHYFYERMNHHTINPLKDESRKLILGMIDKYSSIFRSEYFNICGDETFDLGFDVNKDKDKGELYFNFVHTLITHLQNKGKKVMMWGDVIIKHPEYIQKLPEGIIFLNWGYASRVPKDKFEPFDRLGMTQIVCPGTNSWNHFCEDVAVAEKNISLLAKYGEEFSAIGLLNTNWGDMGNIGSLEMSTYGLLCGACISWNKRTVLNKEFREEVSTLFYGNSNAVEIIAGLSPLHHNADWKAIVRYDALTRIKLGEPYFNEACDIMNITTGERDEPEVYEEAIAQCQRLETELENTKGIKAEYKEEMLMAIRGTALLIKWNAAYRVYKLDCYVDYNQFYNEYRRLWRQKNKESELSEVLNIFERAEQWWNSLK